MVAIAFRVSWMQENALTPLLYQIREEYLRRAIYCHIRRPAHDPHRLTYVAHSSDHCD